jgi:hypothetical protein
MHRNSQGRTSESLGATQASSHRRTPNPNPDTKFPTVRANTNSKSQPTRPITIDLEPRHPSSSEHHKHLNSRVAIMAAPQATVSKRRKFVADGVFYAELNEFFQRELAEEGYSGVEVRVTPTVTDISTSKIFVENISARC